MGPCGLTCHVQAPTNRHNHDNVRIPFQLSFAFTPTWTSCSIPDDHTAPLISDLPIMYGKFAAVYKVRMTTNATFRGECLAVLREVRCVAQLGITLVRRFFILDAALRLTICCVLLLTKTTMTPLRPCSRKPPQRNAYLIPACITRQMYS